MLIYFEIKQKLCIWKEISAPRRASSWISLILFFGKSHKNTCLRFHLLIKERAEEMDAEK